MDINRDNYEGFFLLLLDRELGPAEMREVEKFLEENADLQKEFALLQETVFTPANIVYDGKDLLLHKEEKRRIIPLFWLRIAASVALVLAGSGIIFTITKNHSSENTVPKEFAVTGDSKLKSESAIKPFSKINDTTGTNRLVQNPGQKNGAGNREFVKNKNQRIRAPQKNKGRSPSVSNERLNAPDEWMMQDVPVTARQKTGTPDLQSGATATGGNARQVSIIAAGLTASTPALTAIPANQIIKNEIPEPDYQTDNAISVVALNERNKSITGFFKKITRRAPVNENDRKLRVSVFQISY